MYRSALKLGSVVVFAAILFGCNDKPNGDSCGNCPSVDKLTILCPANQATVKAGNTINFKWCHPSEPIQHVQINVGLNAGAGNEYVMDTGGAIQYPTNTFSWTVPRALATVDGDIELVGTTISVRVHRYNASTISSEDIYLNIVE